MSLESVYQYLCEFNTVSIIVRIIMAVLFGAIIGLDRTKKGRPAGFRTYSMVCLGSTLTMLISQYIVYDQGLTTDVTRISAQVVSGIGFLGAGTIILNRRNQVKGLTTAAALWTSACLGLAIGVGFYVGAVTVFFTIIIIETVLQKLDGRIKQKTAVINIYIEAIENQGLSKIIPILRENNIQIEWIEKGESNKDLVSYIISFRLTKQCKISHEDIIDMISKNDGIVICEEI